MAYAYGALGGTRTPTILLTATSRQRVYQFRHERFCRIRRALHRTGSTARDVTNRGWRDKACRRGVFGLASARQSRQHLLDFDRDPVAIDQHDAAGDRQVIGENLDLVGLGGIQFDDGAATQTHDLMD